MSEEQNQQQQPVDPMAIFDERIAKAETGWELDQIMAEREQLLQALASSGPPAQAEPINSYGEFEKRQKAFDEALGKIETSEGIEEFVRENANEIEALARAEREHRPPADDKVMQAILAAETVEQLEALTNSDAHQAREEQQDYLATRNEHLWADKE